MQHSFPFVKTIITGSINKTSKAGVEAFALSPIRALSSSFVHFLLTHCHTRYARKSRALSTGRGSPVWFSQESIRLEPFAEKSEEALPAASKLFSVAYWK
jgi:hypothetical protein